MTAKLKAVVKRKRRWIIFYLVGQFQSGNGGIDGIFKTKTQASKALAQYVKRCPRDRNDYVVMNVR